VEDSVSVQKGKGQKRVTLHMGERGEIRFSSAGGEGGKDLMKKWDPST